MAKDFIGYQALTDAALRGVVRDALRRVEKQGLVGSHHFYLTFKTRFPGVEIPDFLAQQYPDEMTVILQHQFWGLKVTEELFEVTLTFRKLPATLVIPFEALTAFFDPGVQFGLQFRGDEDAKAGPRIAPVGEPGTAPQDDASEPAAPTPLPALATTARALRDRLAADAKNAGDRTASDNDKTDADAPSDEDADKASQAAGEVVSLDSFRKK